MYRQRGVWRFTVTSADKMILCKASIPTEPD